MSDKIISITNEAGSWVKLEDYASLKAEVEELKNQPDPLTAYLYAAELAKDEVKRLKAEVERLTERNKFLEQIDSYLQDANERSFEQRYNELEAEVERLRKAGDWMCGLLRFDFVTKEWNAAKEGKQP